MLTAAKYYQYLNERFILKNKVLFDRGTAANKDAEFEKPSGNICAELEGVVRQINEAYGFDMAVNYRQIALWQQNFCAAPDEAAMMAACKLVLFCCLADKILDSPRFGAEEKEKICCKLHTKYFDGTSSFEQDEFPEMNRLGNEIREYLLAAAEENTKEVFMVLEHLEKAFISERYMYESVLQRNESMSQSDLPLLVDKSIEFETAVFLLGSIGNNDARSLSAARTISRIFWLIDDLCDFPDDVHAKRRNSLLLLCVPQYGPLSLAERVEIAFQNIEYPVTLLEESISDLEKMIDSEFYLFLMGQLWVWCSNVRAALE